MHPQSPQSFDAVSLLTDCGYKLINPAELAEILDRSIHTIRSQVSREPHKLPPRAKTRCSQIAWRLKDVVAWLDGDDVAEVSLSPTNTDKLKRGAPSGAEKALAKKAGMTVSEYRKAQMS